MNHQNQNHIIILTIVAIMKRNDVGRQREKLILFVFIRGRERKDGIPIISDERGRICRNWVY